MRINAMTYTAIAMAAIISMAAMIACTHSDSTYSEFANIPGEGWRYNDEVVFTPVLNDSMQHGRMAGAVQRGRLAIAVRHGNDYGFSNLWLELAYPTASGLRRDTVNIGLCDEYGRWYGRGVGPGILVVDTLPKRYVLHDSVPMQLRHIMRLDTVEAIEQVGLIFIPDKYGDK